jgi:hypothetical protein
MTVRSRKYDYLFVSMATVWVCYQVQSVVSINQIGLAIWGWALTGLLVSYEYVTREDAYSKPNDKRVKQKLNIFSPQLIASLGVLVGLFLATPPLAADSKWFSALNSKDSIKVEAALAPSYMNPSNSFKYAQASQIFAASNLLPQAKKYALIGTRYNPDYFDSWKSLYTLPNSTKEEKALALFNMKRLDPKNPDVTVD